MSGALTRWFRAWSRRHSYSFFSSLGALLSHRVAALMTVLVLGVAMMLPLGLRVTLDNLGRLELREEEWGALTVFLTPGTDAQAATALADVLRENPSVLEVELVSPEQGLEEFRRSTGFGASLELLDDNPLPWVLSVLPAELDDGSLDERVRLLSEDLEGRQVVDSVDYDRQWLERLQGFLDLGRAAVNAMTLLFGLAVLLVVSNTIRMDVASRAEEIEVQALVGASNGFIRLPFLYAGFWYGALGGLVALLLVNGVLLYLEPPLARLLSSYGEVTELAGLGVVQTLTVWLGAGLLGLTGAWLAVQGHLRNLAVGGSLGRR